MTNKICSRCKTENDGGAKYCTGCSIDLSWSGAVMAGYAGTRTMTFYEVGAGKATAARGAVAEETLPVGRGLAVLAGGTKIGNWVVERLLGKGGMGAVYLAHNKTLGNAAAIKALSPALTGDPEFSARLEREAATQARLLHGNIARVFDFVEQDGSCYVVMEYVGGGSVRDLIGQKHAPLEVSQALAIARGALAGLDFAHQDQVIHRDITASNILLDEGVAKLTDFGIALVAKRETAFGVSIGAPQYMSPEQIERPQEIDARTDIYSLGIVLYEMLTGRVPFDADTEFDVKRAQVADPPPAPRSLNPAIPVELENIVLKALAKDPAQRYAVCAEFAQALEELEPPPAAAAKVAPELPKPEVIVPRRQPRAKHRWAAPAMVSFAAIALSAGLWNPKPAPEAPPFEFERALRGHTSTVMSLAFDPSGHTLASGGADFRLRLWSTGTWTEWPAMTGGDTNAVQALAFSPNGQTLASGNQNLTIKLWDIPTGKETRTFQTTAAVKSVAYLPNSDGESIAAVLDRDNQIGMFNTSFGTRVTSWKGHTSLVNSVAFSPDGTLVSGGVDALRMLPAGSTGELRELGPGPIQSVAISRDGRLLASAGPGSRVDLWSVATGQKRLALTGHTADAWSVAFSPDGRYVASAGKDNTVRVWSVSSGVQLQTLTGHTNWVGALAFSPDGRTLASGSLDSTIRLWRRPQSKKP